MKKILIVDDDATLRMVMCTALTQSGYEVEAAAGGLEALEKLGPGEFSLMITDLSMPGMSGLELLEKARQLKGDLGCLMITAYATVEKAVSAMQMGAMDFIKKPFSLPQLEARVERYFEVQDLRRENRQLKEQVSRHSRERSFIGNSETCKRLFDLVDIVSSSDATVFIRGASGTGKELIARAIHQESPRSTKPFLKINCAAVPETLFESTLFGHEKGAFSGALNAHKGIFEACDGGTLLLDEISEISPVMQAKLLRVLQERVITRVGSTREIPVDVRIIATTNRTIEDQVAAQEFREDLYFRLNVFPLVLPELRERREDIPLLVQHFLQVNSRRYNMPLKSVSPEALDKLKAYHWPGNVRELEHLIERAVLLAGKNDGIGAELLHLESASAPADKIALPDKVLTIEEMERMMIFQALKKTGNHRAQAADLLGISIRTLRNKLHQYQAGEILAEEL